MTSTPQSLGATYDGTVHTVGDTIGPSIPGYSSMTPAEQLAAIQAWDGGVFSFATATTNTMDWLATQACLSQGGSVPLPAGIGVIDQPLVYPVTIAFEIYGEFGQTQLTPTVDFGAGGFMLGPSADGESGNGIINRIAFSCAGDITYGVPPGSPGGTFVMDGVGMTHGIVMEYCSITRFNRGLIMNNDHAQVVRSASAGNTINVYAPDSSSYGNHRFDGCDFTGAAFAAIGVALTGSADFWTIRSTDMGACPYGVMADPLPTGPVPFRGGTLTVGTTDPTSSEGSDGDTFINTATLEWLTKVSGSWVPASGPSGGQIPSFVSHWTMIEASFEAVSAVFYDPTYIREVRDGVGLMSISASFDPAKLIDGRNVWRFFEGGLLYDMQFIGSFIGGPTNGSYNDGNGIIYATRNCSSNMFSNCATAVETTTASLPFEGGGNYSGDTITEGNTIYRSVAPQTTLIAGQPVWSPSLDADGRAYALGSTAMKPTGIMLLTGGLGDTSWVCTAGTIPVNKTSSAIDAGDMLFIDTSDPTKVSVGTLGQGTWFVGIAAGSADADSTQVNVALGW